MHRAELFSVNPVIYHMKLATTLSTILLLKPVTFHHTGLYPIKPATLRPHQALSYVSSQPPFHHTELYPIKPATLPPHRALSYNTSHPFITPNSHPIKPATMNSIPPHKALSYYLNQPPFTTASSIL